MAISQEALEIYRKEYADNLVHEFQQKEAVLSPFIIREMKGGEQYSYDKIGDFSVKKKTSAFKDPDLQRAKYERRWNSTDTYLVNVPLDNDEDIIKTKISPQGNIIQEIVYGANRKYDEVIIKSAFKSVRVGADGDRSTISFPSANRIAHGSAGLTLDKLLELREKFNENEVPMERKRIVLVSAKQETDLLGIEQFRSFDYNQAKPLTNGIIGEFLGFTFVRSEQLETSGSNRLLVAFAEGSFHVGVSRDRKTRIDEIVKAEDPYINIHFSEGYGAMRLSEKSVFKIECAES